MNMYMFTGPCYNDSTQITYHCFMFSIRSDYDGTGLYYMLSIRRYTYSGTCIFFLSFFEDLSSSFLSSTIRILLQS